MPDRWALLIGVDHYIQGKTRHPVYFNHLSGCVRDVDEVEKYLRSVGVRKIERLTASRNGNAKHPQEPENLWPTHRNIKSRLRHIGENLNEGDLLYIHYSGHGILRKKLHETRCQKGDSITGTALAPTDVMAGGAYVTGYQLGVWIRELVKVRKARVCLVLDSCFSGRGLRNDEPPGFEFRTSNSDLSDTGSSEVDYEADLDASRVEAALDSVYGRDDLEDSDDRNAGIKPSWLFSPSGCSVLSGCQLNQKAGEYSFSDDGRNGILTYWMLDILRNPPGFRPPTYGRISQHVMSKIQSTMPWNKQTPVLHGDSFHEFFGHDQLVQKPASVVKVLDQPGSTCKVYQIDIGAAQGVEVGAVYAVYPNTSKQSLDLRNEDMAIPLICVQEKDTFSSRAALVGCADVVIESGHLAILETWAFQPPKFVRLLSTAVTGDSDGSALAEFRIQLESKLNKTLTLCKNYPKNGESQDSVCYSLTVLVQDDHIEIRDGQNYRLSRVPKIPAADSGKAWKTAHILSHLARFNALRWPTYGMIPGNFTFKPFRIVNKKLYELHPVSRDNTQPLERPIPVTYGVTEGDFICLRFRNLGIEKSIYVAIFSFNATWGVEKFYPEVGQPMALVAQCPNPNATLSIQDHYVHLQMEIPATPNPQDDSDDIVDLYRAYIYQGRNPPSWDELCMPNLPTDARAIKEELRTVEPVLEEMRDQEHAPRNGKKVMALDLLEALPDKPVPTEEWTALEFQIRVRPSRRDRA